MIRKINQRKYYSYMPLGYRVIRKLEQIIREEMNKAGAQEVHLAHGATGRALAGIRRWQHYGKELS